MIEIHLLNAIRESPWFKGIEQQKKELLKLNQFKQYDRLEARQFERTNMIFELLGYKYEGE